MPSDVGLRWRRGRLAVRGVYGRQVQGEVSQRAVAGSGAGGARGFYDLKHHRLTVVTDCHLHASQSLRRARTRTATVPRSDDNETSLNQYSLGLTTDKRK